jgi:hypothetical protein
MNRGLRLFGPHEPIEQITVPWSVYVQELDGQSVVDWFLSERATELSEQERAWLEAQRAARLSIWKVDSVEVDKGVWVRDALSDRRHFVLDVSGSRSLGPAHHVLARVVEHEGQHVFCGIHPRILDSVAALKVIERARRHLRGKGAVELESQRAFKTSRAFVRYWEEALAAIDRARGEGPMMVNTHGDALLWTTDHFSIAASDRTVIERALSALDPEAERRKNETVFRVVPGPSLDDVLIGTVTVSATKVRIESNSMRRADELRERVEMLCEGKLRHAGRTHSDPLAAALQRGAPAPATSALEMGPEALSVVRSRRGTTPPGQTSPCPRSKERRPATPSRLETAARW